MLFFKKKIYNVNPTFQFIEDFTFEHGINLFNIFCL